MCNVQTIQEAAECACLLFKCLPGPLESSLALKSKNQEIPTYHFIFGVINIALSLYFIYCSRWRSIIRSFHSVIKKGLDDGCTKTCWNIKKAMSYCCQVSTEHHHMRHSSLKSKKVKFWEVVPYLLQRLKSNRFWNFFEWNAELALKRNIWGMKKNCKKYWF